MSMRRARTAAHGTACERATSFRRHLRRFFGNASSWTRHSSSREAPPKLLSFAALFLHREDGARLARHSTRVLAMPRDFLLFSAYLHVILAPANLGTGATSRGQLRLAMQTQREKPWMRQLPHPPKQPQHILLYSSKPAATSSHRSRQFSGAHVVAMPPRRTNFRSHADENQPRRFNLPRWSQNGTRISKREASRASPQLAKPRGAVGRAPILP